METNPPASPQKGRKRNYFGREILALKIFGISLTGNESVAYKIYSFTFVLGTIYLYTILDAHEYFSGDFEAIADMVSYHVAGFLAVCKVTVLFRNRVSFAKLLAKLEEEPFLPDPKRGGDKEEELIEECIWVTKIQSSGYWVVAVTTVSFTIGYAFVKRIFNSDYHHWQFPYGKFSIVNQTYSPNYEISFIYQSTTIIYMAALFTSIDLLLAAVLVHISYQFKILQNSIHRLMRLSYEEMMKDKKGFNDESAPISSLPNEIDVSIIPWPCLKKCLIKVVKYHTAIIDIAAEVEEAFRYLFLIVFLGTLALICFEVYGASVAKSPQTVLRHLGEGACCCMQVAVVCFWGEQVMHESQLVGTAIIDTGFTGTDLRFQKMLAFIIRRSQNPTTMTAGKFAVISLATFTWIQRTSYSSFMVLRNTNKK